MKKLVVMLLCFAHYSYALPFKITGKVNQSFLKYVIFRSNVSLSGLLRIDTVKLNNDGSFSYAIDVSKNNFITSRLEVDSLRTVNLLGFGGGTLNIEFLLPKEKPVFTGTMAKIQQFADADLAYWKNSYTAYLRRNPNFEKKDFLRTDDYFKIQDSITNDRIENLKAYFKGNKNKFEQAFLKYREAAFIYSDLFYKQSYPDAPYQKFKFYQRKFKVSASSTYSYSDQVSFRDSTLFTIESYQRFVNSFLISELYNRRQKNNTRFSWSELIPSAFQLIDELTTNTIGREKIKLIFLAYLVDDLERSKDMVRATEMQGAIKNSKLEANKELVEINGRLANVLKNKFKKGNPAPDFELLDTLGNRVKLADFKGKRLVIDISAAWCGPCIAAIPDWNKRVNANKDPETIYIYLSVDNTKEESMILFREHEPKGKLLFAGNGGFKSKFAKDYDILILPNQIIIDKNSNLESYFFN